MIDSPALPPADTAAPPMPPMGASPYPKLDETTVFADFGKRSALGISHSKDWRAEAKELYDFESGRQWDAEDEARMREQNRPMVTFNLLSKFIDVVTGLQINNRQEIRCYPRQNGAVAVNEVATGALAWCRDLCGAEFEETDSGRDCLLTGMGWMEDFYDEENYGGGSICQERRDPLEMIWDPMARKKNLTDRRWQVRLKRVTHDEYVELFGKEPTGSVAVTGGDPTEMDIGLQTIMKPQDYNSTGGTSSESRGQYVVADYQFCCVHPIWKVTAQFPGEAQPRNAEFSPEEWPAAEQQLRANGIPHQPERTKVKKYYRAWITGEGIEGGIKNLSSFTFHAITGKRDRNKNLWFGLGRNLKDPQRWVNALFSSIIWQLMVNPKGGVMLEEGAVTDQAAFEDSWADPSKPTFVADGAITAGKIKEKSASNYPQGMDRLMEFSMNALPGVSGINAELLGLTDRQQPGIVEAQRKQGALAIVAWYFDGLRKYYQESGRCMLGLIRDFMADGRLVKIVGAEGAQYVPLLKDPLTAEFDIIVDEAPTSVNMRERMWTILQQVIPMALQAGIKIPTEVLDYMPLNDDLAQKWKKQLNTPPTPQQQQAMEIAQRGAVAKVSKDEASAAQGQAGAQLDTVRAQEIAAAAPTKIHLDQVETIRKAAEAGSIQAGGH